MKAPLLLAVILAILVAAVVTKTPQYRAGYKAGYADALKRETLDNPRVTVEAIGKAQACAEKLKECACPLP